MFYNKTIYQVHYYQNNQIGNTEVMEGNYITNTGVISPVPVSK